MWYYHGVPYSCGGICCCIGLTQKWFSFADFQSSQFTFVEAAVQKAETLRPEIEIEDWYIAVS